MGYLVYCHSCNAIMSVNAKKCPQCGEHLFFEYKKNRTSKTIKEVCPECKGAKIDKEPSWKDSFTYEIHQLYSPEWKHVTPDDLEVADHYGESPSEERKKFFAQCISKGDYILKKELSNARYNGIVREVSIGKFYWKCYKCNGLGFTIREEVNEMTEKIDVRKRVPEEIKHKAPAKYTPEEESWKETGQWNCDIKDIKYILSEGFEFYSKDDVRLGHKNIPKIYPTFYDEPIIAIKRVHINNKMIEISISFEFGMCLVIFNIKNSKYIPDFHIYIAPKYCSFKEAYEEVKRIRDYRMKL